MSEASLRRGVRRRDFMAFLAGAVIAWPLPARAQQEPAPVVGFLGGITASGWMPYVAAFRRGLAEVGYVEGRNLAIEFRWAEGQYDRLPAMAADLVHRQVSVIAAAGTPAALAAKAATTTIPIVFDTISDPVQIGLVASLRRPGGNVTGVTQLNVEIGPKLLELMHEMVPMATNLALLVNPTNPNTEAFVNNLQAVAARLGLRLHVLHASTQPDIEAAFAAMAQLRVAGLVIGGDQFINTRSAQVAALALRHGGALDLSGEGVCDRRRSHELRRERHRYESTGRRLHRPDPQGRQASRPSGRAIHESRVDH
jgi:putative ABC transport system substrate-binding protein